MRNIVIFITLFVCLLVSRATSQEIDFLSFEGGGLVICTPHLHELINAGIPRLLISQRGNNYCVILADNSAEVLRNAFEWLAQQLTKLAVFELDIDEVWEDIASNLGGYGPTDDELFPNHQDGTIGSYEPTDDEYFGPFDHLVDTYRSDVDARDDYETFLEEFPEYAEPLNNGTKVNKDHVDEAINLRGMRHFGEPEKEQTDQEWLDEFLAFWGLDDIPDGPNY